MASHLFFLDIDGTLLRGDSGIHQVVLDAALAFRKAGGDIVLCTGRAPVSTERIVQRMGITLPCILYCGAVLYDFGSKRALISRPMNDGVLDEIKKIMAEYPEVSIQAYTADQIHMLHMTEHLQKYGVKEEHTPADNDVDKVRGGILKLVMTCKDPEILKLCRTRFLPEPHYNFAFSSRRFADIVAGGASKAVMMQELLSRLNIPVGNTFSAGDAMTDYPMIEKSAYSFAPVDANPKILEICDETIPVCEEGGAAVALQKAAKLITSHRD